ncbi:helix-turn-helix domain-containing protein [Sulfurimonas sp. CS5]|uniref:helix-turn-helix domain-containing protein n=1 Tax=Sulfurimonas sp. CS5 TaxID=3391145 RepID=UPI0039E9D064
MSIKLMSLAFATPYPATAKLILLSLCDYADDTGACFPSLATIEKKASCSKSTQSYHVRAFEEIGMLKKEKRNRPNGSRASTIYYINIELLENNAIVFFKTSIQKELEEHKNLIKKIKKTYDEAYKKVRPSSPREQYPLVLSENSTPVLPETPPSSPREHLEPSLYNHHYINQEEEDLCLDFIDSYIDNITEGYKGVRRPKAYRKKIIHLLNSKDTKTTKSYKAFLATLTNSTTQDIKIKDLKEFKLIINHVTYNCTKAHEIENNIIQVWYIGASGNNTTMKLSRYMFLSCLVDSGAA